MNQKGPSDSVIPGLTRNPVLRYWIPAPQGCFLRGAVVAQLKAHGMTALGERQNISPEISRTILEGAI